MDVAIGEEEKARNRNKKSREGKILSLPYWKLKIGVTQTHRAYESTLQQMGDYVRTEDRGPVRDIVLSITEADQALFGSREAISLGEVAHSDDLLQNLVAVRMDLQRELGIELRHITERDEDMDDDSPPEPPSFE